MPSSTRKPTVVSKTSGACSGCKANVGPSDAFCSSCGTRLQSKRSASSTPSAGSSIAEPPKRRWVIVLIVLLNIALLSGSAELVYLLLKQRGSGERPTVVLGVPRKVIAREELGAAPDWPKGWWTGSPTKKTRPKKARPPRRPTFAPGRPVDAGQAPHRPRAAGSDSGSTSASVAAPNAAPDASALELHRASLQAGSIRMVVRHHLPQIRACYDRALKRSTTLGGTVEIKFVVGTNGRVKSSNVYRNTTGHEGLGKCIAYTMTRWRFPRPLGGDAEFVYPFVFSSGS